MKKLSLLLFLLAAAPAAQAQDGPYIRHGLLRAFGTLTPGIMTSQSLTNMYFHGNIEYYLDDRISLRGDGFLFLASTKSRVVYQANHSLFAGASRHISTEGNFDPYFGLLFGLGMTQLPGDIVAEPVSYNPLLSPHIGINYYGEKVFHIFGEVRYVMGKNFPAGQPASSMGELRFSFGLGLDIFTQKEKNKKQIGMIW